MYRLVFILAFSFATIASAQAALEVPSTNSPAWKAYQKLLEDYYFLDNQKADHIACRVSVPQLDFIYSNRWNNFTVDQNLQDFSVTYDRMKGVSINLPHINLSPSLDSKDADPAKTEKLRKGMEALFLMKTYAVKTGVEGILDEMIYPVPDRRKNLSLRKKGNVTVVTYDVNEKKHVKSEYAGAKRKTIETTPTSSVIGTEDYEPINGKLAKVRMKLESTNTTYSVSYQDLGSAFFPERILLDVAPSQGSQQAKPMHLEINLTDCTTSGAVEDPYYNKQ